MLCLKNKIIGFGIFLPVLLSVLFVSPSYAISDRVYVVDSNFNFSDQRFCTAPGSSYYPTYPYCSEYSYIIFEPVFTGGTLSNNNSYIPMNGFFGARVPSYNKSIWSLSNNVSNVWMTSLPSYISSVTVTLTESLSSCPEPEPCPVVPENPYDAKLDNITRAIYVCAGVLLVLYFFYCIYRMLIRSSGVEK